MKIYAEKLENGKTVSFRPKGNSMTPKINNGDLVTVKPSEAYEVGDIVLAKVKGKYFLHLIKAIDGERY